MTYADLAWAAGMFEGEGTATITRCKDGVRMLATLTNTCHETVIFFHERWPGGFRIRQPRGPREQLAWVWTAQGDSLRRFITDVRPHLRTQRMMARFDLLSEALEWRKYGARGQTHREKMQEFRERMHALHAPVLLPTAG